MILYSLIKEHSTKVASTMDAVTLATSLHSCTSPKVQLLHRHLTRLGSIVGRTPSRDILLAPCLVVSMLGNSGGHFQACRMEQLACLNFLIWAVSLS